MLENITIALKVNNNEKKTNKDVTNSKLKVVKFKHLKELVENRKEVKTDFLLIIDNRAVLNENFVKILSEVELEENKFKMFLFSLKSENENKIYNTSVLKANDYTNLVSFVEMSINGALIPTSFFEGKEFKFDDEIVFYNDLNFFLQVLKTEIDIEIIPKNLFTLETDEFDHTKFSKEELDKEINKIIKINE